MFGGASLGLFSPTASVRGQTLQWVLPMPWVWFVTVLQPGGGSTQHAYICVDTPSCPVQLSAVLPILARRFQLSDDTDRGTWLKNAGKPA